eukprot:CAMPEP_0179337896 /NCGR_PEP_ID=MMETSP0797-20121207/67887_1 /TAXON_ID=47934 /ORGANISM="Dinophysis acuminata, Strain DAEP01" /LENGTH=99 /DNA_ID=CAMNT_0021051613 /DNA_START=1 /DNA_END=296 /DNA_ORIENTATION=-
MLSRRHLACLSFLVLLSVWLVGRGLDKPMPDLYATISQTLGDAAVGRGPQGDGALTQEALGAADAEGGPEGTSAGEGGAPAPAAVADPRVRAAEASPPT